MSLPTLIQGLLDPHAYPHAVAGVRLIETHISWVLIAGDYAYKIKKPVDFGFLDFSSLAKRRHCCAEEIRLNRRLAPDIYLAEVAITGSPGSPRLEGEGEPLEWAVKMRAFPADATLDREPCVTSAQIDAIADRVARFHAETAPTPAASPFGTPAAVLQPVRENFRQIRAYDPAPDQAALLARLETWSEAEGRRLEDHFAQRKAEGHVRDCHGDLHLGNIAWADERPIIFDCIEFNPALRTIDVVSELAFLVMDLVHRGRPGLAWRCLNRWLEATGDYAGLAALRFYMVYRAMVRAKVAFIRGAQDDPAAADEAAVYLALAERLSRPPPACLILMHGPSGCGKTWASQRLLEALGAVRLRSDVERKRLAGLPAGARSGSTLAGGLYSPQATRQTFERLWEQAAQLLEDGLQVIVDATFMRLELRRPFLALAESKGLPLRILTLQAPPALLRARVSQRHAEGSDASEADLAVLEAQLRDQEPLSEAEQRLAVPLDAGSVATWPDTTEAWRACLHLTTDRT